ncbi:cupin domain-containing protein [Aquirhabdus sp.]|uniref:cupin domain-containing protein n=1 Tax=Aquirhabdus sp. TaxID=2824160 RepID=UPI00396CD542
MNQIIQLQGLFDILSTQHQLQWQPFHDGIDCYPIYEAVNQGSAAMLLRYQAGARAPKHRHAGYEHILVLSGSQTDDVGHHPTGTLLIHPPGTDHNVHSVDGCIVLAIWEKKVEFL